MNSIIKCEWCGKYYCLGCCVGGNEVFCSEECEIAFYKNEKENEDNQNYN